VDQPGGKAGKNREKAEAFSPNVENVRNRFHGDVDR